MDKHAFVGVERHRVGCPYFPSKITLCRAQEVTSNRIKIFRKTPKNSKGAVDKLKVEQLSYSGEDA